MDGVTEIVRGECLIGEMMPFQIAPDFFDIVQFASSFEQPLNCQPARRLSKHSARHAVVEHEGVGLIAP
ncbi:MAG: hypothetical protein WDN46_14145 [Methylocella sp.]